MEKSLADQGLWTWAQFVELLAPEGKTLVDRDEDLMAQRENEFRVKMKGKGAVGGKVRGSWKGQDSWDGWKADKGKVEDKDKGKSQKGDADTSGC